MSADGGVPLPKAFRSEFFPLDRLDPGGDLMQFLSQILVTDYEEAVLMPGPGGSFQVGLSVAEELVIDLVGLNGFALVLGGASTTTLSLGVEMRPDSVEVRLGAGARLRFPRQVLKPVTLDGDEWVDDPSRAFAEIDISAGVVIDKNWNVTFDGANAFTLRPAMVADSGLVIEGDVALDLSETSGLPESAAIGLPPTWQGVVFRTLTVHLPRSIAEAVPIASVDFENFHVGSGGVSGSIRLNGPAGSGALAGFPFVPTAFEIELRQNVLVGVELAGNLTLPFFDEAIAVEAGFDLDGNLTVGLSSPDGSGLLTLDKPGLLSMNLESITFEREDRVFSVALGGSIRPDVGGLDWPTVGVEALIIDNTGQVRIDGGWIELREQYVLDLHGFQFSLSRLGFGTETNGDRWIGLNGGLKLVDGLTAGASVEGMRIHWTPSAPGFNPRLSLEGVGVEFEVPETLSFRGFVAMREIDGGFRFDGDITLELITLDLTIDGQLVIGYNGEQNFTYFAIYLGVELPVGIPLWTTGLGLYGLAGLFALNLEPGRAQGEAWYEIPPVPDWYHRDPPGVGVAELRKWDDAEGSFALGAGVTLGTVADNGFTFAGRLLLAIVFPGPIILLEGRANVLQQRSNLDDEPVFRALLVIDGREGTITAGLDARYAIADDGELIDLHGSLEVFFDFDDLTAWHLYLGIDEPRERRIGAEIFFRIFDTDSYFMVNAQRLRMGAWTGIDKHWSFGPLSVDLEAWMDGRADLSFKPSYFQGALMVHGGFGVSVFGFGFHFSVQAALAAGVFDPFYIRADFHVSVGLPWPLPDFSVDFSLEWGPEADPPLLPAPVKEVGLGHDLVSATWPLPAGSLLLPQVDTGSPQPEFFDNVPPGLGDPNAPPPAAALIPVVPLDARPEITFGRSVHDDALIGANAQPQYLTASPSGWSRLGDPARNEGPVLIRPAVNEVRIERWTGAAWAGVAHAGVAPDPALPKLYGVWMPTPAESGSTGPSQTKLRVWAKTPFSFTRRSSRNWTDAFHDLYPNYPCIEWPKDRQVCCDFSGFEEGERPTPPWSYPDNDLFVITWTSPPAPVVTSHPPAGGPGRGENRLCFAPGSEAIVLPSRELKRLQVQAEGSPGGRAQEKCVDFLGRRRSRAANPSTEQGHRFTVFGSGGSPAPAREIASAELPDGTRITGLDCGVQLIVDLAEPSFAVRVALSSRMKQAMIAGLDEAGTAVAQESIAGREGLVEMLLSSADRPIVRIVAMALEPSTTLLHRLCPERQHKCEVHVDAYDGDGERLSRTPVEDGYAEVDGRGVVRFLIQAERCGFCLTRVCALVGLSAADEASLGAIVDHTAEELARWQADGDVLPPYSTFRLKVKSVIDVQVPAGSKAPAAFAGARQITQVAYFRTEGPPGLAAVARSGDGLVPGAGAGGVDNPPPIETGVENLERYVVQTVPATVAPEGERPRLTRPVYRGYDVGAQFGTNYVDLMYALAGRDLSLALYDMNDQPVSDAAGRLAVQPNQWGRTDQLILTESERRWLEVVDAAHCTSGLIDLGTVARNRVASIGGFVLDPEATYEARLVPLLAAESFGGHTLDTTASGTGAVLAGTRPFSWRVLDFGGSGTPSLWRIAESGAPPDRYVEQTSPIYSGAASRNLAFPGGTLLQLAATPALAAAHPDQPSQWTDYRLSAIVRSSDDGVIGVGVRMSGRQGYLLTLDRQHNRKRLVRVSAASATVLRQVTGGFELNADMHVSIEAVGSRLRVHIDGVPMLDVTNSVRPSGTIGLYTADNTGARFTDVRVDDLRVTAPVVYRFKFTTSAFADFRHHLLSGDEWPRVIPLADAAPVAAAAAASVDPAGAVAGLPAGEPEARTFDAVAAAALGPAARQRAARAEPVRLTHAGQTQALLVRTAEPIDWTRTRLTVSSAMDSIPPTTPAAVAKLIKLGFASPGAPDPLDETATVLLLEDRDLSGHAIERCTMPSPGAPDLADGTQLWNGDLLEWQEIGDRQPRAVWAPILNDLSEVTLVIPPGLGAPDWQASTGVLTQHAFFLTSDSGWPGFPIERPSRGTLAVGPALAEGDVRISAHLELTAGGAAGIVFRHINDLNYYRFSIDRQRNRRVLSRFVGGVFTPLRVTGMPLGTSAYDVVIEAVGSRITVRVNGSLVASVVDASHAAGAVGFYTSRAPAARFEAVAVDHISRSLGDWRIDDISAAGDRGVWRVAHGVLIKAAPSAPAVGETFAVIDGESWADLRLSAVLTPVSPAAGETGLVWRYASAQEHFRLVLEPAGTTARVVVRHAGADEMLWSGALPAGGPSRLVVIESIGRRLVVTVDEHEVADLRADGLGAGTVGAFAEMDATLEMGPPDIRHAAPSFEPWYVFGPEELRVSGRRVRVASGAMPAAYDSPAGEEARWRGLAPTGFEPAFRPEGVDVRLLDATGRVLHQRRFLPPSAYSALATRMVRAADGTGFVLLPAGAGPLPEGEVVLSWEFRRDNIAVDPQSLILRQEGETVPEWAWLSVP